jgi:hypothetical protein
MKVACARHSSLATHLGRPFNHVYRFDPLQRPPRRNQRAISFSQLRPLLYCAMVLFHHIVEALH